MSSTYTQKYGWKTSWGNITFVYFALHNGTTGIPQDRFYVGLPDYYGELVSVWTKGNGNYLDTDHSAGLYCGVWQSGTNLCFDVLSSTSGFSSKSLNTNGKINMVHF